MKIPIRSLALLIRNITDNSKNEAFLHDIKIHPLENNTIWLTGDESNFSIHLVDAYFMIITFLILNLKT